ncbi:MAG: Brp/Blh family beta-carotene 15,15'-dioxygenase, partial [Opitutales bacterium]
MALGAIAVATGRVTAAHLWLLSFFCLGMPHGTLDVWRGWAWLRQRARPYFAALLFWVGYLGLAGAFYGLWQLLPWLALGVFLALTVWHWGTAEAQWLRLRSGEREALAVARGVWVLALPGALDGPGCLRILGEMLAVGGTGANLETLAETLAF